LITSPLPFWGQILEPLLAFLALEEEEVVVLE
jgi:hypothetical protein